MAGNEKRETWFLRSHNVNLKIGQKKIQGEGTQWKYARAYVDQFFFLPINVR